MENRRFETDGEDNKNTESSSKERRGVSLLSRYLFRRGENVDTETDKSEKDDDSGEKPKRWRKLFRGIFSGIVSKPAEYSATEKEAPRSYLDTWLSAHVPERQPTTRPAEDAPETRPKAPDTPSVLDEATAAEAKPIAHDDLPEINQQESIDKSAVDSEQTENNRSNMDVVAEASVFDRAEQDAVDARANQEQPLWERGYAARSATPEDVTAPPEREVVIERGVGSALPLAAVGLEYLARKKADRKLADSIKEQSSGSEKRLDHQERSQHELQELVRQNKEQLDHLKNVRGIEQPLVVESQNRPRKEEAPTREQAPRYVPPTHERPAQTRSPDIKETEQEHEAARVRPERAVPFAEKEEIHRPSSERQTTVDEVEEESPREIAYEKSHEIKDEPTAYSGAYSVGSIMSQQADGMPYTASAQTPTVNASDDHQHAPLPTAKTPREDTAAYQQAARMGFVAAVVIIILGTIAYLMIK